MFNKLSLSEAANFESWARHLVTLGIFFNSSKSSGSKTSTTPYLQKRIVNSHKITPFWIGNKCLLISLMTLLTLSKPGLDPQLTSMSSNGTELKTIDVITLQKINGNFTQNATLDVKNMWNLISYAMLTKTQNSFCFISFTFSWFKTM